VTASDAESQFKETRQPRRYSLGLPANGSIFENSNPAAPQPRIAADNTSREAPRSLLAVNPPRRMAGRLAYNRAPVRIRGPYESAYVETKV
jgi:hypothetical protein